MPNYPTHASWGRRGAVVMAAAVGGGIYALFAAPILAVAGALAAAAATFVGAIFPDIDHHNSIPRRKAVRALRILVWLGVLSLAALNWTELVDIVDTGVAGPTETAVAGFFDAGVTIPPSLAASVLTLLTAFGLAGLANPALGVATQRHRAWTHSVPVTFLLTAAVAGGVWLLTSRLALQRRVAAVVVVATFFVGILIHLGLDDEILS